MIKPGIGRVVHYHPAYPHALPLAAIVVGLHQTGDDINDRMVNLVAFTEDGHPFPAVDVQLLQDDDPAPENAPHAEWMAFQKGQAPASSDVIERLAKLEALLATGGDIHKLFEQVQTDVAVKFQETGEYLDKRFGAIEARLPAATPDTPASAESGAGEAGEQQPAAS